MGIAEALELLLGKVFIQSDLYLSILSEFPLVFEKCHDLGKK